MNLLSRKGIGFKDLQHLLQFHLCSENLAIKESESKKQNLNSFTPKKLNTKDLIAKINRMSLLPDKQQKTEKTFTSSKESDNSSSTNSDSDELEVNSLRTKISRI